jgi:hypothetical protein
MLLLATRAVAPCAGGLLEKEVCASNVWWASIVLAMLEMGACPVGDKGVGAHCAGDNGVGTRRAGNEGAIVVLATKEIACRAGNKGVIVVLATTEMCACPVGDEGVIIVLATMEMGVRPVGNAGVGAHACDDGKHGKDSGPSCWRRGPSVFFLGGGDA